MPTTTSSVHSVPATVRVEQPPDFRQATPMGLERPSDLIPDAGWQAYPLAAYDASLRGQVVYPRAFWETGSVGSP